MLPSVRSVSFLLLMLFPCAAGAEVKITPKEWVKNRPPGRCGWCVLETLARHHHITALYGLTEDHPYTADPEDLEDALGEADVAYRIQYPGNRNTRVLRDAIEENLGAAIGFRELTPGAGGHIVTLVDFGPKEARVIDPSDAKFCIHIMSRERFLSWWDGFALILEKESEPDATKRDSGPMQPGQPNAPEKRR